MESRGQRGVGRLCQLCSGAGGSITLLIDEVERLDGRVWVWLAGLSKRCTVETSKWPKHAILTRVIRLFNSAETHRPDRTRNVDYGRQSLAR